ncbi:hypothetical protein ACYSNR_02100 [Enterococcus sp. LJL128]
MAYTTEQEKIILSLIQSRRKAIKAEHDALKHAGKLKPYHTCQMLNELEGLRLLEIKNREISK